MKSDNMFRVPHAEFFLTKKCNLNCSYCFERDRSTSLPFNKIKEFLDANGTAEFYTFGGEPLLKLSEFRDLIRHLEASDISYKQSIIRSMKNVTTNGTLIKQNLQLIKELGLSFQISLDGDFEANVERVYPDGKASFYEVEEAIKICSREQIPFTVHGVLSAKTCGRLSSTVFYLLDLYQSLGMTLAEALKRFSGNYSMLVIEDEWTDASVDIFLEQMEILSKWISENPNIPENDKHRAFKDIVARPRSFTMCSAADRLKIIDEGGSLFPCHRISPQIRSLGTYQKGDLTNQAFYTSWNLIKRAFMYSCRGSISVGSPSGWVMACLATNTGTSSDPAYIPPKYEILITEINRFTNYLSEKYRLYV